MFTATTDHSEEHTNIFQCILGELVHMIEMCYEQNNRHQFDVSHNENEMDPVDPEVTDWDAVYQYFIDNDCSPYHEEYPFSPEWPMDERQYLDEEYRTDFDNELDI